MSSAFAVVRLITNSNFTLEDLIHENRRMGKHIGEARAVRQKRACEGLPRRAATVGSRDLVANSAWRTASSRISELEASR